MTESCNLLGVALIACDSSIFGLAEAVSVAVMVVGVMSGHGSSLIKLSRAAA